MREDLRIPPNLSARIYKNYQVNLGCNSYFNKELTLTTNASDEGIATVVLQEKIENELSIAYTSPEYLARHNYDTTRKRMFSKARDTDDTV